MNEEEVAALITRLGGDPSDLVKAYDQGVAAAQDFAQKTEEAGEKASVSMIAVGTAIGQGVVRAIEIGASKAREFGREVIAAWSEAEAVSVRLNSAIRAGGHDIEETRKKYDKFAIAIQAATVIGDEETLSVLKIAESYDLRGDAAIRATKAAIGLAEINSSSAAAMIRMTAAMEKGDTERAMQFARMIPQLRGVKNEQEFLAKFTKLTTAGFEQAQDITKTWTGSLQQMRNSLGDLYEDFGKLVAGAVQPFIVAFKSAIEWMRSLSDGSRAVIVAVLAMTAAVGTLTGAFIALNIAGWPITLTVGAIAAAITILTAGLVFLEEQTGIFTQTWKDIGPIIEEVREQFGQLIDNTFAAFQNVMEEARPFVILLAMGLRETLVTAIKLAVTHINILKSSLGPLPALLNAAAKGLASLGGADLETIREAMKRQDEFRKIQERFAARTAPKPKAEEETGVGRKTLERMEAFRKGIVSLTMSLQEQVDTFGMGGRAASIYKLQLQGASAAELEAAQSLARRLALKERNAEITKEIVNQVTATQGETEALRLNVQQLEALREAHTTTSGARKQALQIARDQLEIDKLVAKGAKDSEVATLKQSQKANREAQKNFDMVQEGLDLIEKYKTPVEKLSDQQAHLQELFHAGAIDAETYRKALEDLKGQIDKFETVQGAEFGSVEAMERLLATQEGLRLGKGIDIKGADMPGMFGNQPGKPSVASQGNTSGVGGSKVANKSEEYLRELVELTREMSKRESLMIEPAGLV